MKLTKLSKIGFLALMTLLFVLMMSMFSISTFAEDAAAVNASEPAPLDIAYCNLSFENEVHLLYAIKSADENVKLLVWEEAQSEYTLGTQTAILSPLPEQMEIEGEMYTIFKYTGISAKQMTDNVYARAYIDGGEEYGTTLKYSILQYAYNKLGKTGTATTNEKLINMLNSMLVYGADAQKYSDYRTDRLATDTFVQVKLTDGALPDGFKQGLFKVGSSVKISAPAQNTQNVSFTSWTDLTANAVGNTAEYTLTVDNVNNIYTPNYVSYSEGLVFESEGDGTCFLVDIGDCKDTDVKIPAIYNGNVVIGIDGAFDGAKITSVSIPATIEEISRRSFRDCEELTDVYYEGSEAEFAKIDIGSGNDAFENASKHFSKFESYKVIFINYDGKMLKGEIVKAGESATAPAIPIREGYTFDGWDITFNNVTANVTTTAKYTSNLLNPTIMVENIKVDKSVGEVTAVISIINNPGITSMVLSMNIDDSAFVLKSATKGTALPSSSLTPPGTAQQNSPYNFLWDAIDIIELDKEDGELLTIVLTIKDTVAPGSYDITFTYADGDIADENLDPVEMDIINGTILID